MCYKTSNLEYEIRSLIKKAYVLGLDISKYEYQPITQYIKYKLEAEIQNKEKEIESFLIDDGLLIKKIKVDISIKD